MKAPAANRTGGRVTERKPALATGSLTASEAPRSPEKRLRLLLAEDHPVVRKGLIALLEHQPGIDVLAEARDGQEALRKAKDLKPDVVLVDIEMPQLNGFVLTELLHRDLPQIAVLILSSHSGAQCVPRIIQSGARGYLSKEASAEELVTAVRAVAAGGTYFGPEVAQLAMAHLVKSNGQASVPALTSREREVLTLIAEGLYNKEIAARLNIGTRTVETHRERIMRKLGVHSAAGLTTYAVANGFVVVTQAPTFQTD